MRLFLVFEGIDGAGKSSQLAALVARLESRGLTVRRLVEPTDGPHGREIRRRAREGPPMSASEELELFLADRRENVAQNVIPALEAGEVVVQDRYYFSTAAYQAARPELELSPEDVVALHTEWAPEPDCVLLLDLSVERGLARVERRGAGDAFEEESRQRSVREHFHRLAETTPCFTIVDADQSPEEVARAVWAAVEPLLEAL
jgi:dTMP kinase